MVLLFLGWIKGTQTAPKMDNAFLEKKHGGVLVSNYFYDYSW